jgi:hypothetical protein
LTIVTGRDDRTMGPTLHSGLFLEQMGLRPDGTARGVNAR